MNKPYIPQHTLLGKSSEAPEEYSPALLCPIPRSPSRQELGLDLDSLPFAGVDIWNAYELSWLDTRGKPEVAMARFQVPFDSPSIIESKSFKLYLNSLNQSRFDNRQQLADTLQKDLSSVAGAAVRVDIISLDDALSEGLDHLSGECLDSLSITVDDYLPNPGLLKTGGGEEVSEQLYSHLLRSSCPVTGQPDWGSMIIGYRGAAIDREGLLKYIISYRENNEFHEQCVERMFVDIMKQCQPSQLTVYARYLRRGGLDINPYRSTVEQSGAQQPDNYRLVRQ